MKKRYIGLILVTALVACETLRPKHPKIKQPVVDETVLFEGRKGVVQFNHYAGEPKGVYHMLGDPTYE